VLGVLVAACAVVGVILQLVAERRERRSERGTVETVETETARVVIEADSEADSGRVFIEVHCERVVVSLRR
jgi:hypothetical protein